MKNNRISNELKRPVWRERGLLFRAAVLALLLVSLLTQGLPMSAIAEQVQVNTPEVPATDAPESIEGSTPAEDTPSNEPANASDPQEGGAPQEGNNEQESGTSQDDANAQNADAKQNDATAKDGASDSKKDDTKDAAPTTKADDAKNGQKSEDTQKSANPAIDSRVESNGLIVTIYAPEGAFPEGTTPRVEPVSNEKFMAAVDDLVDGDPVDARAVDISFIKDGNEIEPANGLLVSVNLSATTPVGGDDFAAVHVRDNGSTEVVDNNATKQGASFKATDFSVYGIVGGSVIRGEDEQYTRIKVVFRNGSNSGAVLSTQIVRAGDSLAAPDATPITPGTTFRSWRAAGKDVDSKYLTSVLSEQDIQNMISTYGATKDSEGTNLWLITIASHFEEGYRAYFHWNEKGAAGDDTVAGCLSTGTDGTVHLKDIQGVYKSPHEDQDPVGWIDEDGNKYALDATLTLTKDTHLYPVFPTGKWIKLDMGGAPALSDVFAQYNEATHTYELTYDDLPNSVVSDTYFYPGYTFDGWYVRKTSDGYEGPIAKGSTAQLGDTQDTIYAKWTPDDHVAYTIVYLAEDSSGTPGHGKYYVASTEVKYGTAGARIPASLYRDHVVDAYHHYCKDDDGERALYTENEREATIDGDGSTVKAVYFNSNRIKLQCFVGGNNILPDVYVKPGEEIDVWLSSDPAYDRTTQFDQHVYKHNEQDYKGYIEDGTGYTFSGKETTIPYVEANCVDVDEPILLEAHTLPVVSQVKVKYYYEALGDEPNQFTLTLDGETHKFVYNRTEDWQSGAQYNAVADEHFGLTYDNGGLEEWAYKGSPEPNNDDDPNHSTGVVQLIPSTMNPKPGKIEGTYRYQKYYYDHYFVRKRYDLQFQNCENVSPQPSSVQLMFGTKLWSYLPNYTSDTTRVYGGATYTFDGWYLNPKAASDPKDPDSKNYKVDENTTMSAQSTTLFAGWSPKVFTITFDAQGGTIMDSVNGEVNGESNSEINAEANTETLAVNVVSGQRIPMDQRPKDVERKGYVFGGWYLDQDCTIPLNYDTFTSQRDTTIYARWIDGTPCKITYHDADGTVIPSQNNSFLAYSVVKLDGAPEATHNGLPFLGWSTAQGDVNKLVPNTFIITSDVDLYAVYGNVGYSGGPKLTLHANYPNSTEDVKTEPILVSPDTKNGEVKLPGYAEVEFTCPEGYQFVGWAPEKDGAGKVYAAGKPVAVDKDTDLYAVWTRQAPKKTPRTGDSQSTAPVVALLVAGALVIAAGIRWRRRKE